jgi:hypothetical protein
MSGAPLILAIYLLASACGGHRGGGEADAAVDPVADAEPLPAGCDAAIVLDTGSSPQGSVGPVAIGGDGLDICLHLDGTTTHRNHFAANTPNEEGQTSSFELALYMESALLQEGWDVTVGIEDPRTFANLEWEPWTQDVPDDAHLADMILHVALKPTTTVNQARIDVHLFDPLE